MKPLIFEVKIKKKNMCEALWNHRLTKKRPRNASGFFDMKSRIWEKTIAPVWGSLWVAEVGVDVLFLRGEWDGGWGSILS